MEWWYYCLGGGALVLIVAAIIAWLSPKSVQPEIADMAKKAQQTGAIHYCYFPKPPVEKGLVFYRARGDKLECCFAEVLANGSLGWI